MSDMANSETGQAIRETYTEYPQGDHTIAEIGDPANEDAWITSTLTYTIEP